MQTKALPFVTWLEDTILSEISQTQKVHFTQFVLHVDLKKIIIEIKSKTVVLWVIGKKDVRSEPRNRSILKRAGSRPTSQLPKWSN